MGDDRLNQPLLRSLRRWVGVVTTVGELRFRSIHGHREFSAGNLNTAALTLFLALHLTAAPKIPWLLVDDPVQSMDEVNISQFAALLRTLSKQHGRQIVIAVDEKPLFDYLALELRPSFPGDRLITAQLGRSPEGMTTPDWEVATFAEDKAISV